MGRWGIHLVIRQTAHYRGHLVQLPGSNNDECGKTSPAQTQMSSAPMPRSLSKAVPRVALVQLDGSTTETLTKAFAQCRIEAIPIGEDFPKRLGAEQFQGCVLLLGDHAAAVLEAVRSSRSNHKMLIYGIVPRNVDVRRFSKFGINTLIESPVDRGSAANIARSTCSLLLHELRRYVRIPLVIEVSIQSPAGSFSGSSREISGGGMSVQLGHPAPLSDKLRASFSLPSKSPVSIEAEVCWQKSALLGLRFQESDPARQVVKGWINSFLGLD